MDQLWAPWRLAYVAVEKPTTPAPCFICRGLQENQDRQNLIALRTPRSVVLLNRFPYNNGHLLVAPVEHRAKLDELADDDSLDLHHAIQAAVQVLDRLLNPDGHNLGLNLGSAAGAGLPGHLHWHVVPRWHGDTNFMTVVNDARVIVQSLDALHDLLISHLPTAYDRVIKKKR
jgi:ATP adenylyltransferase